MASSAVAIKVPPIPKARAPEPTGFGDEAISALCKDCAKMGTGDKTPRRGKTRKRSCRPSHRGRVIFKANLFSEVAIKTEKFPVKSVR